MQDHRDYDTRRNVRSDGRYASDGYGRQPQRSSAYRGEEGDYRRSSYGSENRYASSGYAPRESRAPSQAQGSRSGSYASRDGYAPRGGYAPRSGGYAPRSNSASARPAPQARYGRSYTATQGARYQAGPRQGYQNAGYRYPRGKKTSPVGAFIQKYPYILPIAAVAVVLVLAIIFIVNMLSPASPDPAAAAVSTPAATQEPAVVVEATPAPTPTAEPVVLPTMVPTYKILNNIPSTDRLLGLPESERVDDSYFDDAVFVGDSVSEKLRYYVTSERKYEPDLLGTAKFLTAASFSSRNALSEVTSTSLHPTYQGQKMKLEDVIAAMGAKKVFIMLGMNDVGVSGVEKASTNLMKLLKAIKEKSPDVQIFVQSATPRVSGDGPTTEELFEYNIRVYEYCKQLVKENIYFLDVAYIMRDSEGKLIKEYCSDLDYMALHFTNEGCQKWIDFLYTHALVPVSETQTQTQPQTGNQTQSGTQTI